MLGMARVHSCHRTKSRFYSIESTVVIAIVRLLIVFDTRTRIDTIC